ncbi:OstA-like protein [Flavihumibacter sp. UBA7668]|uniref:OstA-like protein n=1 Tax=Flavihumibacter sp. UBA7668 TaxID=1946542 RepID=UPI0025B9EE72|nr:OstA-like protein [Flavihumibacter sp. UBA7668]
MRLVGFVLSWLLFLAPMLAGAQEPVPVAADTMDIVLVRKTDRFRYLKKDSVTELQMLAGNVFLEQGTTKFYCDSAVINPATGIVEAFGNVHINDADSIHTYAQYLIYYSNEKKAYLKKNVRLTDGKGVLTTNDLEYDTNLKIGTYTNGGKVVSEKTVLTSKEATYYGDMKDVYFKKDVKMKDPEYDLETDSLLFNTESRIATFITKTRILSDSGRRDITTSEGYYDMKNKVAKFGRRPQIKDGTTFITGDDVGFDDNTGDSYARGNAVFRDTAQGISILANDLKANKKTNTLLATQRPLMIIKQKEDSIFVTADTLFSARLTDKKDYQKTFIRPVQVVADSLSTDSTGIADSTVLSDSAWQLTVLDPADTTNRNRYFQAWNRVRIFSDSLQAVCDSLFYSGVDSIFRMFRDPVAWANGTQITGDTIFMYTKNQAPERLHVFDNGLVINRTADDFYNQIKGNTINGYFIDGAIHYMRAKGSAESIYYAQDQDSAYSGVNRSTADIIDFYFANKELNRVVFRSSVEGTLYPFRQVNHGEMRLRGFKWLEKRRPKTKFELFEDPVITE